MKNTLKFSVKVGDAVRMVDWNVGDLRVMEIFYIDGQPYARLNGGDNPYIVHVADMVKCSAGWLVTYDDVTVVK